MKSKITKLILIAFISLISANISFANKKQNSNIVKYIHQYKDVAINEMRKYRIPASITLAQGILESGWGLSELANKSNNHFGIKCKSSWKGKKVYHDDDEKGECFRKYDSPEDSYRDHSMFLNDGPRYEFLFKLSISDYKGWAHGLKKAGYATNPKYAHILIDLIELYDLSKYDNKKGHSKQKEENNETLSEWINGDGANLDKTKYSGSNPVLRVKSIGNKKGRELFTTNNVKFVKVEKGDSWSSLSNITGKSIKKLYEFNEVTDPDAKLEIGSYVFYSKKKKSTGLKGQKINTEKEGETIYKISQRYAIRSSILSEANSLMKHEKLPINKTIELR